MTSIGHASDRAQPGPDVGLVVDTIPTLAWAAGPDGSADFFNQRWLDYTGLSAEQARDWGWTVALHPDDLKTLSDYWQSILNSGEAGEIEARLRRFDGIYRWFLFRATPSFDNYGKVVKWFGTNTDIEDRKCAEDALRSNEASPGIISAAQTKPSELRKGTYRSSARGKRRKSCWTKWRGCQTRNSQVDSGFENQTTQHKETEQPLSLTIRTLTLRNNPWCLRSRWSAVPAGQMFIEPRLTILVELALHESLRSIDFSVQPLCSLCLCGSLLVAKSTTETQRTQRLHREESILAQRRKVAKKALYKRGSALRLCAFAREIFSVDVLFVQSQFNSQNPGTS
jgi:PAS domain S-box-containing protein